MEFDEDAVYNWETKEVERKTINVPTIQQRKEETNQDSSSPPLQMQQERQEQEDSTLYSTPRQTQSLIEIYESCNLMIVEPESFKETSKHKVWNKAMEEEIRMIKKNETWELVDFPLNIEAIRVKCIYKTKLKWLNLKA